MAAALTLLLIGSLLQGALCGEFKVSMPQTIEVLRGSCVTIPCSFEIQDQYESHLENPCRVMWINYQKIVVFDSSNPQTSTNNGELRGDLRRKDCTTTLNNMQPADSNNYFLRLECDKGLQINFIADQISISFTDVPPRPTLTPSALKEKEGTSVSLTCSAPAPCVSPPPALTWTPVLGESVETLQENQDKTKAKTSVMTFTASQNHHGKTISCTATYNKQDGSTESAVSTSLTADISCSDQHCGPYSGVLLLAVAGVSLSVNVLYTVCMAFLWKSRKRVKPKEVDQTYMSLDPRDRSPEYDVIAQSSR